MTNSFVAHVRAGACDVAIPVDHLVQAITWPAQGLTPLPRRHSALIGLIDLDGGVVPVVDLGRWVALGAPGDAAEARIIILRSGPSLIGFRADALMGMHRVNASEIRPVHHDCDDEELFASVIPASDKRPMLCLLEVKRLMALALAWCNDADLRPSDARLATQKRLASTVQYALFDIGDDHWAIPATAIAKLVVTPVPELRWAGQLSCGICTMAGRKLPMVDLAFAQSAANPLTDAHADAERHWMAVLDDGPKSIGVVVSRCDRLLALAADDIVPTQGGGLHAGTTIVAGLGEVLVLDVGRLFRAVPEAVISQLPGLARNETAGPATAPDSNSHYLVFEADRHYASPVAGMVGVMALAADTIADLAAGRRATIVWRGDTIAVFNLPAIDGTQAVPQPQLAVVLEGHAAGLADRAGRAGSAIAIRSITDWLPAQAAQRSSMRMNTVGEINVITSQRAHQGASLVVVDLAQIAYMLN